MARVALIKLFTGLNLGVSQLSGELQRAGHETVIIYFKDFLFVRRPETHRYLVTDYALEVINARAEEYIANCYKPFTETEYRYLVETLERFRPDLIGFSLTSLPMKQAAEVTARLRRHFDVPVIWGGPGPTLEPELALEHADMACVGEGEEPLVALAACLDAGRDHTDIPGLWLRRNGEAVRNASAPYPELNSVALPDFEPSRTS